MLDANDRDDHELLRNGEIARLLAKYEPAVTARCWGRIRSADAEDVAQNVMLRVYKEFNRGKRWNDQPFRVVIHQVTGWTIKDYFDGRRYTDPLPDDWDSGNPGWADEIVERDYMRELFSHLSGREQEIGKLHYFAELGAEEIAHRLDSNRNAIDQALFRIRGKLRELVSEGNG
jgi:RNA polymerase sigma factor (sigma-70 family)